RRHAGAGGGLLPGRAGARRGLDRGGDPKKSARQGDPMKSARQGDPMKSARQGDPMTRVAIATLGCKVNAYDSATIADRLRAAGCHLVALEAPADVVIVNSCTVTDAADAESRRLVRRARRLNPRARVVLTGCYAQTKPHEAAAL